jgi:hypothetical protein
MTRNEEKLENQGENRIKSRRALCVHSKKKAFRSPVAIGDFRADQFQIGSLARTLGRLFDGNDGKGIELL